MKRAAVVLGLGLGLVLALARSDAAPTGGVIRVEHRAPTTLPTRGPPAAPVTIELFFTPGAGSRIAAYRNVEKLQADHPNRIRLVYRIVKGNGNARLHYAVLEAYAEGKFDAFMDALNKSRITSFTDQALLELGKSVGVDPTRLGIVIGNPPAAYDRVLDGNSHRLRQRVRGGTTPNALFNGRRPQTQLAALSMQDLEREYLAAKDAAEDLIDRGADPRALAAAFDAESPPAPASIIVAAGQTDDTVDDVPTIPPLATPALELAGMPSIGRSDAPVTIAVLCNPTSPNCAAAMRTARLTQDVFSDDVRVVWAPFFDVSREDAGDLSLLSDAALCAEQVGTSSEVDFDSPSSAGWRWVETMLGESSLRRRRVPADQLIDKVAEKLHVDHHAFATCRAQLAGTSLAWIEDARRAGVRTSPSTVVDGRVYPAITDIGTLQLLVEAELAPGFLGEAAPAWRRGDNGVR